MLQIIVLGSNKGGPLHPSASLSWQQWGGGAPPPCMGNPPRPAPPPHLVYRPFPASPAQQGGTWAAGSVKVLRIRNVASKVIVSHSIGTAHCTLGCILPARCGGLPHLLCAKSFIHIGAGCGKPWCELGLSAEQGCCSSVRRYTTAALLNLLHKSLTKKTRYDSYFGKTEKVDKPLS